MRPSYRVTLPAGSAAAWQTEKHPRSQIELNANRLLHTLPYLLYVTRTSILQGYRVAGIQTAKGILDESKMIFSGEAFHGNRRNHRLLSFKRRPGPGLGKVRLTYLLSTVTHRPAEINTILERMSLKEENFSSNPWRSTDHGYRTFSSCLPHGGILRAEVG